MLSQKVPLSKYILLALFLLLSSCIPTRIAPNIKDYKITKGKKFKRQLPKQQMFIFKDPKPANEFYNYINIKYSLNHIDVGLDVPFNIENKELFFSFNEVEIPTKTINLVPIAIDGLLAQAEMDPMLDEAYTSRKGNWYIAIEVYDIADNDCLRDDFEYKAEIINYLTLLKNEYLATLNYNEVLFKD